MTENNRLKQIQTPMYQDASTTTLNEFIHHAKMQFEQRVTSLYEMATVAPSPNIKWNSENEKLEHSALVKKISESLYTTTFYDIFWYAGKRTNMELKFPVYHFRVNPKNINFETTLTDLREYFNNQVYAWLDHREDGSAQGTEKDTKVLKNIPDWEKLFGTGEFPFMSIYVFRLGNTEYFAYDIHR